MAGNLSALPRCVYDFPLIDAGLMLALAVILLVRLVQLAYANGCSGPHVKRRLASHVLMLNAIGSLLRLVYAEAPGQRPASGYFASDIALIGLWLGALMIITGFWLDVLKQSEVRNKTLVICIFIAWLVLFAGTGLILGSRGSSRSLLDSLPVLVDFAGLVIVNIILVRASYRMNPDVRERTCHALRWIWAVMTMWILYMASVVSATLSSPNSSEFRMLFTSALVVLCVRRIQI